MILVFGAGDNNLVLIYPCSVNKDMKDALVSMFCKNLLPIVIRLKCELMEIRGT